MATRKPTPIQRQRQIPPSPEPGARDMQDISAPRMADAESFKLLLTVKEAARALAIDRSTLYLLLMRGEIRSITIGRARRIPVKALEDWIEELTAA